MITPATALLATAGALLALLPQLSAAGILAAAGILPALAARALDALGPDAAGLLLALLRTPAWAILAAAAVLLLLRRTRIRAAIRVRPGRIIDRPHLPSDASGARHRP